MAQQPDNRTFYILDLGEMHKPIAQALIALGVEARKVRYLNPLSHWFHGNIDRNLFRKGDVILNHVGPEDCPEGSGRRESVYNLLAMLSHPARGLRVVHDECVFALDCSKVAQLKYAERHGIQLPSTEIILVSGSPRDRECLLEASKEVRFGPTSRGYFLKPSCGGTGKGVVHFKSREDLVAACENYRENQLFPSPGTYLLQEDVNPDRLPIYRLEVIGGEAYYWLQVDSKYSFDLCPNCPRDKEYRNQAIKRMTLNPSEKHLEKPTFRIYDPGTLPQHFQDAQAKAVRLVKDAKAENAGFEFVPRLSHGQPSLVCIDINFSSNYNREAELHSNRSHPPDAYGALAKMLLSK